MNCTVRNVIYMVQCKVCHQTYIGETTNFRARMSAYKSNSSNEDYSTSMEVYSHLYKCGGGFWKLPFFKVKVENKITRLVIESNFIKTLKPDLNRDERNLLHLSIGSYDWRNFKFLFLTSKRWPLFSPHIFLVHCHVILLIHFISILALFIIVSPCAT